MDEATPTTLTLALARVRVRVTFDASERANALFRYGAYAVPGAEADLDLDVRLEPRVDRPQPEGVPYPAVRVTRLDGGRLQFDRRSESLVYDPRARTATLAVSRSPRTEPGAKPPSFESALRILLSLELASRGGLLVHASGFGRDDAAVVFAAFSGGGKTTTARKLPHEHVLSDDHVALVHVDREWRACALPFVGLYGRPTVPRESPLRAIALLEKAATPSLRDVPKGEALARLLGCIVSFAGGEASRAAFERTGDLVEAVPVHALALTVDEPVLPWLERMLAR